MKMNDKLRSKVLFEVLTKSYDTYPNTREDVWKDVCSRAN